MVSRTKMATFEEFKDFTRTAARGKKIGPSEPRIWCERADGEEGATTDIRFPSLEAGAKLLSAKNRALLRAIIDGKPQSVTELAALTGRAEQNVLRTLNKLAAAGIVRLDKGAGRALHPILAARKVRFEIDLVAS